MSDATLGLMSSGPKGEFGVKETVFFKYCVGLGGGEGWLLEWWRGWGVGVGDLGVLNYVVCIRGDRCCI